MAEILPEDGFAGTLIGRVSTTAGPSVVAIRHNGVFDITESAATVADLCNASDPVALAQSKGDRLGDLDELVPTLLAPIDLQAIKAAGVTFAVSLLERLIEEHSKGDLSRAETVRGELNQIIGVDITTIKPGTPEAEALKKTPSSRAAPGRPISRSALALTPKSSPRRRRCRRSATAQRSASGRTRTGTIRSLR